SPATTAPTRTGAPAEAPHPATSRSADHAADAADCSTAHVSPHRVARRLPHLTSEKRELVDRSRTKAPPRSADTTACGSHGGIPNDRTPVARADRHSPNRG